jgi:hypothetical protein
MASKAHRSNEDLNFLIMVPVYGLQIKKKGRELPSLCQPAQGSAGSQKRRSA